MTTKYYVDGKETTRDELLKGARYVDTMHEVKDIYTALMSYEDNANELSRCGDELLEKGETIIDGCLMILNGNKLYEA